MPLGQRRSALLNMAGRCPLNLYKNLDAAAQLHPAVWSKLYPNRFSYPCCLPCPRPFHSQHHDEQLIPALCSLMSTITSLQTLTLPQASASVNKGVWQWK